MAHLGLHTTMNVLHLPTYALVIGYAVFWLEMYVIGGRPGITTPTAWVALACLTLFLAMRFDLRSITTRFARYWSQGLAA